MEELKDLLDFECSSVDCQALEAEVTEEEIMKVLFSMPSNKSPGLMDTPVNSLKQLGQC